MPPADPLNAVFSQAQESHRNLLESCPHPPLLVSLSRQLLDSGTVPPPSQVTDTRYSAATRREAGHCS